MECWFGILVILVEKMCLMVIVFFSDVNFSIDFVFEGY